MADDGRQRSEDGGLRTKLTTFSNIRGNPVSERISSFKELRVYQLAFALPQEVFEASKTFPAEERFALTDQIRRGSRSIGANIAEAWQKRPYAAHFVSKLTDADGEQSEVHHWLDTALACDYVSVDSYESALEKCSRIGQMLGTMMADSEKWCQKASARAKLKESRASAVSPQSSVI